MPLSRLSRAIAAGCLCAGAITSAHAQPPSFTLLGFAPGGTGASATGISADGQAASGWTSSPNISPVPGYIWTATGGRYDLGLEPGLPPNTPGQGISGDGSTVVGYAWSDNQNASDARAYRWRANPNGGPGTFQSLGTVGPYRSYALGASNDGSVVVGYLEAGSGLGTVSAPARWTEQTGMVNLAQYLPSLFEGRAMAVSRDGSTTVGYFLDSATGGENAFTLVGTQAHILAQLPGTVGNKSGAFGINFNGSVAVGKSGNDSTTPTIWRNGVAEAVSIAPGYHSGELQAVSDDGLVAVGQFTASPPGIAAIWTPQTGMEPLADYLAAFGLNLPAGWSLREANGVSADGLTICGRVLVPGTGLEGFVAHVPSPGSAGVPLAVLLGVIRRKRRTR